MNTPTPSMHVRAVQVLRNRKIWIAPILLAAAFTTLMATVYFGSVVNPTGHLHGLPVMIVDQDTGAVVDGQHQNVGASLTSALEQTSGVTSRLNLTSGTLQQAQAQMDKGGAYATLVIPATLTRSVLLADGVRTPGDTPPATAAVQLDENSRLGHPRRQPGQRSHHPRDRSDLAQDRQPTVGAGNPGGQGQPDPRRPDHQPDHPRDGHLPPTAGSLSPWPVGLLHRASGPDRRVREPRL